MPHEGKITEVPFARIAAAQRDLKEEIEAVNWLLQHLAEDLEEPSPTRKAIARRAAWTDILGLARWEGAFEVASLLEDAMQTLGEPPADRRRH
jgi:hypothetical protein